MNMTIKEFNIWLLTNGYNQSSLAIAMGLNRQTITGYKNNGRFPILFELALKGLGKDSTNIPDIFYSDNGKEQRLTLEHNKYDLEVTINTRKKTIDVFYMTDRVKQCEVITINK